MHEIEVLRGCMLHHGMPEEHVRHYLHHNAHILHGGRVLKMIKKHKKNILKALVQSEPNMQRNSQQLGGGFFDWFNRNRETIYKVLSHAGKVGKKIYGLFAKNPKVDYIDV